MEDYQMSEVLHRNQHGIVMVRTDRGRTSTVKVFNEDYPRDVMQIYRFRNIPERFESPYISWENLDCVGGWVYDRDYLKTAVQSGKKLYAGTSLVYKDVYTPTFPPKEEVAAQFLAYRETLPPGIVADFEKFYDSPSYLHIFFCRTGRIADYIQMDAVWEFYEKLGLSFSPETIRRVEDYCRIELRAYSNLDAPFNYANAFAPEELITAGLLLGYPLESTASLI